MTAFRQNRHFFSRRFIAWLACVAILLNSLAPAISHAMASLQGKDALWAQICSTSGTKYIPLDLGAAKPDGNKQPQSSAMEHCAYCVSHAGAFAIFSDVPLSIAPSRPTHAYPALFYRAPSPLFIWAAASPRAPPALS